MRYDAAMLAGVVGPSFQLIDQRRHEHITPWGSTQLFQFGVLKRVKS
jgi:hypothetical protein